MLFPISCGLSRPSDNHSAGLERIVLGFSVGQLPARPRRTGAVTTAESAHNCHASMLPVARLTLSAGVSNPSQFVVRVTFVVARIKVRWNRVMWFPLLWWSSRLVVGAGVVQSLRCSTMKGMWSRLFAVDPHAAWTYYLHTAVPS